MSESFYELHGDLKTYGNDFKVSKKDLIYETRNVIKENGNYDAIKIQIQDKYEETNALLKKTFLIFLEKLSTIEEVKELINTEKIRNEFYSADEEI